MLKDPRTGPLKLVPKLVPLRDMGHAQRFVAQRFVAQRFGSTAARANG
jgi:hypothetical protein